MDKENNYILRLYNKDDYVHVINRVVNEKYLNKYLNKPFQFRVLKFLKLFESTFYVLENNEGLILASGVIRRKFNIKHFKYTYWLYGIEVVKEQRGRGIGSVLVSKIMGELRHSGVGKVYLKVDKQNISALKMYHKLGFIDVHSSANVFIMCAVL